MTVKELCVKLKKIKYAAIVCHIRPDGDAIGSAAGLKLVLNSIGINADLVCDSPIPAKFGFLFESGAFLRGIDPSKGYDAHIAVDCSDEKRIGSIAKEFLRKDNTVNIDHHISNTRYAKTNYVEQKAATAEMIYDIAVALGVKFDRKIADCLLLGICTDTGNFAHKNVTESTLVAAARLTAAGGSLHTIINHMYKIQKRERAELFAKVIAKVRYFYDDKIAIITVTQAMMREAGATDDMTEGFIDFPLSVEGVEIAMCLMEWAENRYKVSFRSSGKADVNDVASVFGGGGHLLASGCMINGEYEEVVDKLVYAAKSRL